MAMVFSGCAHGYAHSSSASIEYCSDQRAFENCRCGKEPQTITTATTTSRALGEEARPEPPMGPQGRWFYITVPANNEHSPSATIGLRCGKRRIPAEIHLWRRVERDHLPYFQFAAYVSPTEDGPNVRKCNLDIQVSGSKEQTMPVHMVHRLEFRRRPDGSISWSEPIPGLNNEERLEPLPLPDPGADCRSSPSLNQADSLDSTG